MNDFSEKPRTVSPLDVAYRYRMMKMDVAVGEDKGGKHYSPHYHDHDVHLFVFGGAIQLRMGESDWRLYENGSEIVIPAGTVHEARVEPGGWSYLAGNPRDAEHPFEEFAPPADSEG